MAPYLTIWPNPTGQRCKPNTHNNSSAPPYFETQSDEVSCQWKTINNLLHLGMAKQHRKPTTRKPDNTERKPVSPTRAGGGKRAAKQQAKQPTPPFFFATQSNNNSCQWVAINNLLQRVALTETEVRAAIAAQHPDFQAAFESGRLSDCMANELLKSKAPLQLPAAPEHKITPGAPLDQIIETLETALQQQKRCCPQHEPQTLMCRTPEHALVLQKTGRPLVGPRLTKTTSHTP